MTLLVIILGVWPNSSTSVDDVLTDSDFSVVDRNKFSPYQICISALDLSSASVPLNMSVRMVIPGFFQCFS